MKTTSVSALPFLSICAALLTACAGMSQPTAHVTAPGVADVQAAALEAYDGPKARLAVAKFSVKAAGAQHAIGDGLADMLATALFQSNRFIVLERQALSHVLAEQDIGASGRVRAETAARTGEIEGAELLIMGTVTEFDPGSAEIGASVGRSLAASTGPTGGVGGAIGQLLGDLAGSIRRSQVAIDLRIVDTGTSRVLASTSVEGSATDVAGLSNIGGPELGVGLSGYAETSVEKAVRIAIQEGVRFVVSKMPDRYYRHMDGPPHGPAENGDVHSPAAARSVGPLPSPEPPASETTPLVYVRTAFANLREAPDTKSRVLTVLRKGTKITVIDMKPDWYRVQLEDGSAGWLAHSVTTFSLE